MSMIILSAIIQDMCSNCPSPLFHSVETCKITYSLFLSGISSISGLPPCTQVYAIFFVKISLPETTLCEKHVHVRKYQCARSIPIILWVSRRAVCSKVRSRVKLPIAHSPIIACTLGGVASNLQCTYLQ